MTQKIRAIIVVSCLALAAPAFVQAQSQTSTQTPPPAPAKTSQPDSQSGKININEVPPPPPDVNSTAAKSADGSKSLQMFDPLGAEKDIEVGKYYFKKGNYDAAIERYQDAAQKHAGYAKPFLLLGEAYEKKDDAENALKAYRQYVRLYPEAPDRKKVDERIAELEKKVPQETKKPSGN